MYNINQLYEWYNENNFTNMYKLNDHKLYVMQ